MEKIVTPLSTVFVSLLVGCSTSPVSTQQASAVPRDHIFAPQYLTEKQGDGAVIVKRDSGFQGMACSWRVFLDATPVADLNPGEKLTLYLSEGEYLIGGQPNGICAGGLSEAKAAVQSGKTLTYGMGMGSNGDFSLQPTAF